MHIGDVVFCGDACGEVAVCLLQRTDLSVAVRLLVAGPGGRWIAGGDDYAVWAAPAVEPALAWQIQVDGSVLVLRC